MPSACRIQEGATDGHVIQFRDRPPVDVSIKSEESGSSSVREHRVVGKFREAVNSSFHGHSCSLQRRRLVGHLECPRNQFLQATLQTRRSSIGVVKMISALVYSATCETFYLGDPVTERASSRKSRTSGFRRRTRRQGALETSTARSVNGRTGERGQSFPCIGPSTFLRFLCSATFRVLDVHHSHEGEPVGRRRVLH